MPNFDYLRGTPWEPTFTWVETSYKAADRINSFHEDYPLRVPATQGMLELPFRFFPQPPEEWWSPVQSVENGALQSIHWFVFDDQPYRGLWRTVRVRVGNHRPPPPEMVPHLMNQLQETYLNNIRSIEDLVDWYADFETIHPFQDGNGRVGGIIVAAFAHGRHPDKGWLAPNQ